MERTQQKAYGRIDFVASKDANGYPKKSKKKKNRLTDTEGVPPNIQLIRSPWATLKAEKEKRKHKYKTKGVLNYGTSLHNPR